jgi:hypothetical protein
MNTKLTVCHECGRSISSDAVGCPHCLSDSPHDICQICHSSVRPSSACRVQFSQDTKYSYHPACLDALFAASSAPSCPVCRVQLGTIWPPKVGDNPHPRPSCPNCGHPDALQPGNESCHGCSLLIYANQPSGSYSREGYGEYKDRMHTFCAERHPLVRRGAQTVPSTTKTGCLSSVFVLALFGWALVAVFTTH